MRSNGAADESYRAGQVLMKPRAGEGFGARLGQLQLRNQHQVLREFQRFGGGKLSSYGRANLFARRFAIIKTVDWWSLRSLTLKFMRQGFLMIPP